MGILSSAFGVNVKAHSSGPSKDWIPAKWFGGGLKSQAGIVVSPEMAECRAAHFACQRAISESIAMLPKGIFQSDENGGRTPIKNLSSRVLKREANPIMSPFRFFELLQRQAISAGNGYAELQFDKKTGDVVAAWPIPPDKCKPRWIERAGREIDIAYDITLSNQDVVTLTKDRVLHIAGIGFDGLKGYPLVDYMVNVIGLDQALEEYSSMFFRNGAGQSGWVTVPDGFSEEQINNMRSHYSILNEGLDNAHRWKFLYESAKFQPSSVTPQDSQMTESKIFQIQEIARFHRMPLHKIQETSKATGYASLEQFNNEFVSDTLSPWIINWEEEINRKFFSEEEDLYVKFNVNAILRGDAKSRSMFYRTMVFTGIMTPNEARALEELPPIEGGNKRMIPLNMGVDGEESERSLDSEERVQD